MSRRFPWALLAAALLAGCAATTPGAPAPVASGPPTAPVAASALPAFDQGLRPFGPPQTDGPAFGAISQAWVVEGERVALYGVREQPFSGKNPGTTSSRYVYVGGRVYGIHWDDAAKFADLKPGETVNLHPADGVACLNDPTDPDGSRCWRLYHVFPGSRRINPLGG